jgi:DNA-binding CsgD family transcriptional regulator
VGNYAEIDTASMGRGAVRFTVLVDNGWRDQAARDYFVRYTEDVTGAGTIPFPGMEKLFAGLASHGASLALRSEICPDTSWYRSIVFNEYRKPAFNDGFVMSFLMHRQTGRCSHLGMHQDLADRAPSERAKAITSLVHHRIAPLIDTVLSNEQHRSRRGLTPRLQQTLDHLLNGLSEKQIAAELDLSLPTVHEYIRKLYQHFDVHSHAQLLAFFLARRPKADA